MKSAWAKVVVFLFVILVLAITPAKAQLTSGTVSGTVVDETGAVIPGATVRLVNEETGVTREQESGGSGSFIFDRVSPGTYTVTVSMQGFRTFEATGVDVRIGKVTSLGSVRMEVGPSVEVVTVTETAAPLMQAESAQITGSYTSETVTETMLGVFGIDTLAFLTPGVQPGFGNINSNNAFGDAGSFGGQIGGDNAIGANGMRARFTNFTIDGQDNNDVTISGPGYFVDMFDSVEEFQITTNQFNADQGRNLGASINIITKSGTNEHHGTIYWFHDNAELFNAVNSDPGRAGETKPDKFIQNFFGFTWGGPIVTDKLFGFGAWQRFKSDFSQFDDPGPFALDPAGAAARGAIAGLGTNTADIVANKSGFASSFGTPVCQPGRLLGSEASLLGLGVQSVDSTGTFAFVDHYVLGPAGVVASALNVPWCSILRTPGGNTLQDEFMMKLDWVGEKNTAGGKYMWQDFTTGPFDLLFNGINVVNLPARSQFANMYHTIQLSPRMLNEFRFSYQRLGVFFEGNPNSSFSDTGPIQFPVSEFEKNLGFIIPDFPFNLIGTASNIPQARFVNLFQFADNWSLVRGRHTIKAGAEVRRVRNGIPFLPNVNGTWVTLFGLGPAFNAGFPLGPNGLNDVAGMDELLTNQISFSRIAAGEFTAHVFETHQFYYVQDDFRVRPNLTLNLGLRYEHFGQPIDGLAKEVIQREMDPARAFWLQTLPIATRTHPVLGSDDNNWAPRIGFAYTPRFWKRIFGEDQTVIRGGYGLAYDVGFQNILLNVMTNAPRVFSLARLFDPVNQIPGGGTGEDVMAEPTLAPTRNTFNPRRFTQSLVSGILPGTNPIYNPYVQQWSLGIQREIKGTVAEVRYVGTRGIGLFQSRVANPTFVDQLAMFPSTVPLGLTPDPVNGRLFGDREVATERCNCARSEYHGLQTRWDFRNLFNQFTGGVGWTWSKNIDNASEVFSFSVGGISDNRAQNVFDIVGAERGLSNFDLRNTFTWHTIWHVPTHRDQIGTVGKLLGGWEFPITGFIFSGRPWTPDQSTGSLNTVCRENSDVVVACRPFAFNPDAPISAVGNLLPNGSCVGVDRLTDQPIFTCTGLHWILNDDTAAAFFGTPFGVGRNGQAGDGTVLVNLGIFKNTYVNLGENRVNIQFRTQFINLFNHRNHGVPASLRATSSSFADEGERNTGGRVVRFGIRVVF